MGISIKNTRSTDCCAEQTDVVTNLAVITNIVIKRVYLYYMYSNMVIPEGIIKWDKGVSGSSLAGGGNLPNT